MTLRLTNKATDAQKAMLTKLGYIGTGKYVLDLLTMSQAAEIIDGLLAEQRMSRDDEPYDWET